MSKSKSKTKFEIIGEVAVDTGMLMITDPVYVNLKTYKQAGKTLKVNSNNGIQFSSFLKNDLGFVFHTPDGDGWYPVFGEIDESGALVSIIIDLER